MPPVALLRLSVVGLDADVAARETVPNYSFRKYPELEPGQAERSK